ncbi:MAG: hypothetical protein PHS48_07110, partial [Bacteroidales bacterium]|nr:hypothetical protein [Bacteroidales bacterium]
MKRTFFISMLFILGTLGFQKPAQGQTPYLINEPVDISPDFRDFTNTYFFADSLAAFDPTTGSGRIGYKRAVYK